MNKRLAYLEEFVEGGKADAFARYALAMEYRKAGQIEAAWRTFDELRTLEPSYLPMYLMAGQLCEESGRTSDARAWFQQGLALANGQGNPKAAGEIMQALQALAGKEGA